MSETPFPTGDQDRDKERFLAGIAYIGIFFVVPLFLARKKSPFLQFHVRQGIVLFVVEALFSALPFIGWFALAVPAIASIYGMIQALAGRQWELPILGKYAKKINL